ncbi:MAG: MATE family efflux transporter [Pseudomonadales bacterium]|nr:MATE family efflux transporter [Pseudomonadales bacterium]
MADALSHTSPTKREETATLWRLALPLIFAQLAQMGMGVVDAVMAGNYSSTDLAGVALGGSVFWPVMMLMMGMLQALTPTISQLNGAGRVKEIGEVVRQGIWLALFGGICAAFLLNNIGIVYSWMSVAAEPAAISIPYLRMCSYGVPALLIFFSLRFLADGTGFTKPALYISVSALLLKIPLNYVLIYGEFGLPELGGVGCGLAQAIIMWWQLAMITIVVTRKRFRATTWMSKFTLPQWRHIKPLLVLGIPIGATIFAEMGLFSLTTLLLGRFGSEVVSSHNIAMNLNGVLFMPALALGMASTIRIGFRVGAGEVLEARSTALIAMLSTVAVGFAGSIAIFFFREDMVSLYTEEASVMSLSATLLLFVVVFLMFDAAQATAAGALRGYKDTKTPMWIAIFSYWGVGLPLECILGFGWIGEPMGVYGFWIGLASGVGTAALLLSTRLWLTSNNTTRITRLSHLAPN